MKYLPILGRGGVLGVWGGGGGVFFQFLLVSEETGDSNTILGSEVHHLGKILGYPFFLQTPLYRHGVYGMMGRMPWKDGFSFICPGAHPCCCCWAQDRRRRGELSRIQPPLASQVPPWGCALVPWAMRSHSLGEFQEIAYGLG